MRYESIKTKDDKYIHLYETSQKSHKSILTVAVTIEENRPARSKDCQEILEVHELRGTQFEVITQKRDIHSKLLKLHG